MLATLIRLLAAFVLTGTIPFVFGPFAIGSARGLSRVPVLSTITGFAPLLAVNSIARSAIELFNTALPHLQPIQLFAMPDASWLSRTLLFVPVHRLDVSRRG